MAHIADNEHNSGLVAVLADVLDDMTAPQEEGHRLLVHCQGGASRTGLVLRSWLMRTEAMSAEEATARVARTLAESGDAERQLHSRVDHLCPRRRRLAAYTRSLRRDRPAPRGAGP